MDPTFISSPLAVFRATASPTHSRNRRGVALTRRAANGLEFLFVIIPLKAVLSFFQKGWVNPNDGSRRRFLRAGIPNP